MAAKERLTINILWIGRPSESATDLPENYRITTTAMSSDIRKKVGEIYPDLIILDLTAQDGEEFKALVDIHQVLKTVPVVGLVDMGTAVLKKAIESGLHDFLFVPIEVEELESRMRLAARRLENIRNYGQASGNITECTTDLELPTDFSLVAPLADILTRDLRSGNLASSEVVFQLRMTLSELLTNAMEHGSLEIALEEKLKALEEGTFDRLLKERQEDGRLNRRTVKVRADRTTDRIRFSIRDQGKGFDVEGTMARLAEPNPTMPCGRGLYLLQQFVDEFEFSDGGRTVTLIKKLRPEEEED